MEVRETPKNAINPDWENIGRVHDWRNHVSDEIAGMWHTFTDAQKEALARQAELLAANEEWD